MNARRRNTSRASSTVIFAIIMGAAISAGGGVLHAYYKNQQVKISREIDATERRIEQTRLEIRTSEMRMDQLLNRFVIRQQLEENGSTLKPIPVRAIEEIHTSPSPQRAVVAVSP